MELADALCAAASDFWTIGGVREIFLGSVWGVAESGDCRRESDFSLSSSISLSLSAPFCVRERDCVCVCVCERERERERERDSVCVCVRACVRA
jgi:hypothetical protein